MLHLAETEDFKEILKLINKLCNFYDCTEYHVIALIKEELKLKY